MFGQKLPLWSNPFTRMKNHGGNSGHSAGRGNQFQHTMTTQQEQKRHRRGLEGNLAVTILQRCRDVRRAGPVGRHDRPCSVPGLCDCPHTQSPGFSSITLSQNQKSWPSRAWRASAPLHMQQQHCYLPTAIRAGCYTTTHIPVAISVSQSG